MKVIACVLKNFNYAARELVKSEMQYRDITEIAF